MAIRHVFISLSDKKFVKQIDVEFKWFAGFAAVQKQKSVKELHCSFLELYDEKMKVLEVSTKSTELLGVSLSAFNLMIERVKSRQQFSVECAFQSSKVFKNGGPYVDLLSKTSIEAKKDERLKTSGELMEFQYSGKAWKLIPRTMFYDWLYINALSLNINKELATKVIEYDAFTDIEFNPGRSINCQARSVALYVSLHKQGLLSYVLEKPENYVEVILDKSQNSKQISMF